MGSGLDERGASRLIPGLGPLGTARVSSKAWILRDFPLGFARSFRKETPYTRVTFPRVASSSLALHKAPANSAWYVPEFIF